MAGYYDGTYELYVPNAGNLLVRPLDNQDDSWNLWLEILDGFYPDFGMSVVMYGRGNVFRGGHNTVVTGMAHVDYASGLIYWEHPRGGEPYVFSPKRVWMPYKNELRIGLADFDKDYCSAVFKDVEPDGGLLAILA